MPKLTVIASHAPTMKSLRMAELASYQCSSCSEETVALAGCDPFCSHCGSPAMKERKQATVASVFKDTEEAGLTSAQCPHCLVANVMIDSELAALAKTESGHVEICCVECGTGLNFQPDVTMAGTEEEESEEASEDDEWSWGDSPESEEASSEDESEEEESEEEEEESEEESEEEEASAGNPMIIMPKQPPTVATAESEEEEEEEPEEEEEESEEESEEASAEDGPNLLDPTSELEDIDIDVLEAMSQCGLGDDATVAFIPLEGKILANVNDTTVAVLKHTPELANADIFGKPAYMEAIAQSFGQNGLDQTLAAYGFSRNSYRAPKAVAMAYVAEKAKAVATAQTESVIEQSADKLAQGLQLATAGLTRGFFRGTKHAVKDRLISDLTTAGVQNAQGLVERALAETEDEHNQAVLALAQQLATRSQESLNELAETIADVLPVGEKNRSVKATASVQDLERSISDPLRQVTTASVLPNVAKPKSSVVASLAGKSGTLFS